MSECNKDGLSPREKMIKERGKDRGDLMRRLFAVAISVGVAKTISELAWIKIGSCPNLYDIQQLSILVVALTVTVLSWDGYLWAIFRRPLLSDQFHGVISLIRFTIDIYLVLIYMILMITIGRLTWWLPIIFVVYVFYIVWDFFKPGAAPSGRRGASAEPAEYLLGWPK